MPSKKWGMLRDVDVPQTCSHGARLRTDAPTFPKLALPTHVGGPKGKLNSLRLRMARVGYGQMFIPVVPHEAAAD